MIRRSSRSATVSGHPEQAPKKIFLPETCNIDTIVSVYPLEVVRETR